MNAAPSGKSAPTRRIQPQAWWTNADREYSHGFASWIRNAAPETANASGTHSRHHSLFSFPLTSPSSAAPASIITCAQTEWASMWIVEFVKNTITGHMKTPSPKRSAGHR